MTSSSLEGVIPPLQLSIRWNLSATLWEPRVLMRSRSRSDRGRSLNGSQAARSPRSAQEGAGVPSLGRSSGLPHALPVT